MSITVGNSHAVNFPWRENAPPVAIGQYLLGKASVEFASVRDMGPSAEPEALAGAPAGAAPPDPHAFGATGGAAANLGSASLSAGAKREVAEGVFDEFSAGISTETVLRMIDRMDAESPPGTNANLFEPLFAVFAATRTDGNFAVALSYDSQLCFVAGSFTYPKVFAGSTFTLKVTIRLGFSGAAYARLMTRLFADSGRVATGVRKLRAFFSRTVGASTAQRLVSCGKVLRVIGHLGPFMWAIDIACCLRDLSLMMCRAAISTGFRRGQLNSFAVTFTYAIFRDVIYTRNLFQLYPEYENYAMQLARRFDEEDRAAVRSLLTHLFGREPSGDQAIWYPRCGSDLHLMGEAFGSALRPDYELPPASSDRRAPTVETIENIRALQPNLDVRIAGFFASRIEPWIQNWERAAG